MLRKVNLVTIFLLAFVIAVFISCKGKHSAEEKELVITPEQMDAKVSENIKAVLSFAKDNDGKINEQISLWNNEILNQFYESNSYQGIWSSKEKWFPIADSMFQFINNAKYYGLYPDEYHVSELDTLRRKIATDSLVRTDAIAWTKAELLLSDAFMRALKELKEGRLVPDSASIIHNEKQIDSFFIKNLMEFKKTNSMTSIFEKIEPSNKDYISIRNVLKAFVDNMDTNKYIPLTYPYKDSLTFIKQLHQRLLQSQYGNAALSLPDSASFASTLKKYQADKKLVVDGKAGREVVKSLNTTDNERFKQIAITLDRYKLIPNLPERYIWVNIPSFNLKVWDHDSLVLESRVVVGKPDTRTPIFSSAISDMVTFPQWTIPESIIKKDILPQLKKDPGYLERKGYSLVSNKGETINPYTVDWSKYSKGIPWNVVQGSGDDNALGIFKFNFNNPYSVYLHDTNQRYLFSNANRALSHGCVRVQKWEKLAFYIAQLDSMQMKHGQSLAYNADSIKTWITNKSRKRILVKSRLPLFIEYFTCEAKKGTIVFYDDIYDNDKLLAQEYFKNK